MRDPQQARPDTVLRKQKPAAQALVEIVQAIAPCGLRDLQTMDAGIVIQSSLQIRQRGKHSMQPVHADSGRVSADLDYGAVRSSRETSRQLQWDKPFASDHAYFHAF